MVAGNVTAILLTLRTLLDAYNLTAYIVPSGDAHHSEYVAPCHERRAYITNFDGSAGTAVITQDYALLWTDSRYFLQAEEQLNDTEWILMKSGEQGVPTLSAWLTGNLSANSTVGVDPSLYSKSEWDSLSKDLTGASLTLEPVTRNFVDELWDEGVGGVTRPPCSSAEVMELGIKFTGKNVSDKLAEVRASMKTENAVVLVISELDEVAWLLNLRGDDIPYNPFFFSYVIVLENSFELFVNDTQIDATIRKNLEDLKGVLHPYENVATSLQEHTNDAFATGKFWISKNCNYGIAKVLDDKIPVDRQLVKLTPIALMKAIKNDVEAQGLINCHVRDGAAVIEYLAWLEKQIADGEIVTEISGATKLEEFRSLQENFRGLSFDTISASGPNAASPHYSPSNLTDRQLSANEIYLVDSGGQYLDGTTDITRTVYFGEPSDEIKDAFTRVLKGVIGIRTATFPRKSPGAVLDTLARKSLWDDKLDYGHGTGHGIGSYLGVHEGPFSIGSRTGSDDPGMDLNMFTSDEPGYYKAGNFGIRIENIIRVVNATLDNSFITFDDVTLVPIQLKLVNPELLTAAEIEYLNAYHAKIVDKVGSYMRQHMNITSQLALDWLDREAKTVHSGASFFQTSFTMLLFVVTISVAHIL